LYKKLKVFVDQELPLLLDKGYLSDNAESRNIADFRNTSAALVAQPVEGYLDVRLRTTKRKALAGIWTPDLYLTKVTLYQAELPRQLNEQSSQ
jgi:hypothetical protein